MGLFRSGIEKSEINDSDERKVNCPPVLQLLGGNQSLALALWAVSTPWQG
jgi:hypothetical protein